MQDLTPHGGDEEVAPGWLPPKAAERPAAPAPPPFRHRPVSASDPQRKERVPADAVAMTSLALALTAFLVLFVSVGLGFWVSLPCSFVAWRLGSRGGGDGGRRSAIAQVAAGLGIAGIVAGILAAVVWGILAASGYSPDDLRRDLERQRDQVRQRAGQIEGPVPSLPPSRLASGGGSTTGERRAASPRAWALSPSRSDLPEGAS